MRKAYVQYNNGTLVSGVLIVSDTTQHGPQWLEVPSDLCCSSVSIPLGIQSGKKGWIKFSPSGEIVPGSTIIRKKRPSDGTWKEIPYKRCC